MTNKKLLDYLETFLTSNRINRFNAVLKNRTKHFTVAIEDVYQLHNTSAVIRSCDVFGVHDVNVIEEVNMKRIDREIAMGAQKWVNINRYNTVDACIANLQTKGYQIIATTPHNNSTILQDFDVTKKSCFFFGRETDGLSQNVLNKANGFLKIPMYGFTESLNISVSAAIILQHVTSQIRNTNIKWQLSSEEQLQLRFKWIKNSLKNFDKIVNQFYNSK